MDGLLRVASVIDVINRKIGEWVSWMILAAVVISAGNAVIRKAFNISSNAWLELQWYLFGAVFMLASAWTLQRREHIKVDLLYNNLSRRGQHIVTLLGHILFLLPYAAVITVLMGPVFMLSFRSGEISANAGGLSIWPAKLILLVGFAMLLVQGVSELIKHIAVMRGILPEPEHHSSHS